MATFGERLRELRNDKRLSQKQFGERFGLSESAIGMYERNEREPSFKLINDFAEYFDVWTDYLLGRSDDYHSSKEKLPSDVNIAYLDGVKHELDPEVVRRLKDDIELFKQLKKKNSKGKE